MHKSRIISCGLLLACCLTGSVGAAPAAKVWVKGGAVYVGEAQGQARRLPLEGTLSEPCLSPDGKFVAFVKDTNGKPIATGGAEDARPNELWLADVNGRHFRLLVRSKDDPDLKKLLAGIHHPVFASDDQTVYFLSSAWAVSDAVHAADVRTGQVRFVCDGNSVDVVRQGRYRGDLIVEKHKYHPNAWSYNADWLVTPQGREIKRYNGK